LTPARAAATTCRRRPAAAGQQQVLRLDELLVVADGQALRIGQACWNLVVSLSLVSVISI
jgi:hypothetical protein